MKNVMVALAVSVAGSSALACTYDMKSIQKSVAVEAAQVMMAHMTARGFRSTTISGQPRINSVESIPSPMCPKELTHFVVLNVTTKRPTISSPKSGAPCFGQMTVKVVAPFTGSEQDAVTYTVAGSKDLTCAQ